MSFTRAQKDSLLVANDVGLHLQLNTEKRWNLKLGGKITVNKGYKLTESYSRLTFKPKKLKHQYFIGTRSFFPTLFDPTTLYYYEYLYYHLGFIGGRWKIPYAGTLGAQVEVQKSGDRYNSKFSASLEQKYFTVRGEKGITGRKNDYLADAQVRIPVFDYITIDPGVSVWRYNSYATTSSSNDFFSCYYMATGYNFPRSLTISFKLEDRVNRDRINDFRLSANFSYLFSNEDRDKFPWEY
jgi:hypothetical protein